MGGNLHRLKDFVSLFRINDLHSRFLRSDGDEVPSSANLIAQKRIDRRALLAEKSHL
jgi:hypothetical protein